jgi:hypothetical protein
MRFTVAGLVTAHDGGNRDGRRLHGNSQRYDGTNKQNYFEQTALHGRLYHQPGKRMLTAEKRDEIGF